MNETALPILKILLSDPRVDVNKVNNDERTPLIIASNNGKLEAVKMLLASGRKFDTEKKFYYSNGVTEFTAEEVARHFNYDPYKTVANLIRDFVKNPEEVKLKLRKELSLLLLFNFLSDFTISRSILFSNFYYSS